MKAEACLIPCYFYVAIKVTAPKALFSALVRMASRKFQAMVSINGACLSESFPLRFSCHFEVAFHVPGDSGR